MKNKLIVSTSTAFCGLIAANVCWAGVTLPSNVRDVADMLQYSAQEQQKKAFATAAAYGRANARPTKKNL